MKGRERFPNHRRSYGHRVNPVQGKRLRWRSRTARGKSAAEATDLIDIHPKAEKVQAKEKAIGKTKRITDNTLGKEMEWALVG